MRVSRFIEACRASTSDETPAGFEPHFVVNNGCVSDEAREKWTTRRTAEVENEKRNLPLSTDALLCEMIHAQVNNEKA
jgi:hypothetical protein